MHTTINRKLIFQDWRDIVAAACMLFINMKLRPHAYIYSLQPVPFHSQASSVRPWCPSFILTYLIVHTTINRKLIFQDWRDIVAAACMLFINMKLRPHAYIYSLQPVPFHSQASSVRPRCPSFILTYPIVHTTIHRKLIFQDWLERYCCCCVHAIY